MNCTCSSSLRNLRENLTQDIGWNDQDYVVQSSSNSEPATTGAIQRIRYFQVSIGSYKRRFPHSRGRLLGVAEWQGTDFWYRHSQVRILPPQSIVRLGTHVLSGLHVGYCNIERIVSRS